MSSAFVMTASPSYVAQAVNELRELDNRIRQQRLAPGVLRFETALAWPDFSAQLRESKPVFVRHVHPIDAGVPLSGGAAAVAASLTPLLGRIQPGDKVAVQARLLAGEHPFTRYGLKEALDPLILQAGGEPAVQGADQIISITVTETGALAGISTAAENLSDWAGGEIRFRREEGQVSRARFKLLEAFATFDLAVPDGGHALDLGAAPGGWTSLLLERGLRVTAVDTGELDRSLLGRPGLTFLRENVREVTFLENSFDLVTCDMSWNPLYTAALVERLAGSVKPGAHGVLTVKLLLENPTRTIRTVRERLSGQYHVERVRQLFHNRDEVTMHLIRRGV